MEQILTDAFTSCPSRDFRCLDNALDEASHGLDDLLDKMATDMCKWHKGMDSRSDPPERPIWIKCKDGLTVWPDGKEVWTNWKQSDE